MYIGNDRQAKLHHELPTWRTQTLQAKSLRLVNNIENKSMVAAMKKAIVFYLAHVGFPVKSSKHQQTKDSKLLLASREFAKS